MRLIDRLYLAKEKLDPVQPQYCILYEENEDEPVKVIHPDPSWMACAIHGGVLPPVWVYLVLAEDEKAYTFEKHTQGYLLHETQPIGPMTEEEAMEYLVFKDVPREVWERWDRGNRPKMLICRKDQLPKVRTWRDAWRLSLGEENESALYC